MSVSLIDMRVLQRQARGKCSSMRRDVFHRMVALKPDSQLEMRLHPHQNRLNPKLEAVIHASLDRRARRIVRVEGEEETIRFKQALLSA